MAPGTTGAAGGVEPPPGAAGSLDPVSDWRAAGAVGSTRRGSGTASGVVGGGTFFSGGATSLMYDAAGGGVTLPAGVDSTGLAAGTGVGAGATEVAEGAGAGDAAGAAASGGDTLASTCGTDGAATGASPAGTLPAAGASDAGSAAGAWSALPSSVSPADFDAVLRLGLALMASTSMWAIVSIAVPPPVPAEANHSRILASRPAFTGDMCVLTMSAGTPSSTHFLMIDFESTPSSFARSKIRLANPSSRDHRTRQAAPHEPNARQHNYTTKTRPSIRHASELRAARQYPTPLPTAQSAPPSVSPRPAPQAG